MDFMYNFSLLKLNMHLHFK